jgi:pimeloyl-ACP methyl ester carboxylesterase
MNEPERAALPGSFARLSRGYVHYELLGPEGGAPVVLVPGLSVPYSTWERNAASLASAGYRVLRYEHYGRGYSDRPSCAYDLELFVEQLAELLRALGLDGGAALIGLSMGGPVVAAAANRLRGLVRAVVLVDPLFRIPEPNFASRLLRAPLLGDAVMALRGGRILAEGQRGDFYEEASFEAFIPSYLPQLRYRGIAQAVLSTMRSMPSWPLRRCYEELGRSGPPVLLLWGREDRTLAFEQSGELMGLLPRARFRGIEGAGHVPHWERPAEVNEAILEFLGAI